ncbi:hypothetical protein N7568_22905, partial [Paenarthrobacter aurescens]|nr:hypothetical protein [Paenarthrobacter aurescens]
AIADLQGDVAVAEVIGRARQFERIGARDVEQLSGTGADAHDTAVFGLQTFAVIQRWLAALQKQPDVFAFGTETAQTAFAARFEGQVQLGGPDGLRV